MAVDLAKATEIIFHRVHRTGEEIKNDLPNWVERVVKYETWKKSINPETMQPYQNVGQWLVAHYPLGPGFGQTRYAISYDEFIALCDDRPALKELLIQYRPKGKRGGDRKSAKIKVDNVNFDHVTVAKKTGNSRLYIEERLQRDHKRIWNDYLAGKYRSARQAGIAAGFISDGHDPVMRLKNYWSKASAKQKREFLQWLQSQGYSNK